VVSAWKYHHLAADKRRGRIGDSVVIGAGTSA
jgi:hypothetical protein